ncbi:MAG: hypothetical protein HZB47_09090 [Nitrosomonadales bacterium]|nr:hypothetical protein [Nitrosomonadales bacterium]
MNIRKPILVVLALILLCCNGCSTVTFGYNHADWILRYWITDYTSFSDAQRQEIHLEVDDYLRWHRKTALPEYTTFLQDLNGIVNREGALSVGDVMHLRTESSKLYQLTMAPTIRPAARLLAELDSRQIEELADTFAERNRKQRKKLLQGNEQEMLELRAERHVEFVEGLVGRLSAKQEKKITGMSLQIPFASRDYIEQREAKQAMLIFLLKDKAGEDRIAALLRQWITAPEITRTPLQQQSIAAYENAMNEMTVRIFELLTARQKQHLGEKIVSYIDDFRKLNSGTEAANTAYGQTREK